MTLNQSNFCQFKQFTLNDQFIEQTTDYSFSNEEIIEVLKSNPEMAQKLNDKKLTSLYNTILGTKVEYERLKNTDKNLDKNAISSNTIKREKQTEDKLNNYLKKYRDQLLQCSVEHRKTIKTNLQAKMKSYEEIDQYLSAYQSELLEVFVNNEFKKKEKTEEQKQRFYETTLIKYILSIIDLPKLSSPDALSSNQLLEFIPLPEVQCLVDTVDL